MEQARGISFLLINFLKLYINVNIVVIVNLLYDLSFSLTGLKKGPYATGLPVGPARDIKSGELKGRGQMHVGCPL